MYSIHLLFYQEICVNFLSGSHPGGKHKNQFTQCVAWTTILLKFPLHRICVIVKTRVVHAISTQNICHIDVQDLLCVFVFCLRLIMKESKNLLFCKLTKRKLLNNSNKYDHFLKNQLLKILYWNHMNWFLSEFWEY